MIDFSTYSFLYNSVIAIFLSSILSGIIGSYITINRLNYLSGGIAHSSFAGIGVGYFLGVDPFIGGVFGAGFSAFIHSLLTEKLKERSDSIISMIWSFGMAIGIIFAELTPGYKPNLMSFLFGDILVVPSIYLVALAILVVATILFFGLFFNKLLLISFDEEFARINNLNVWMYKTIALVLSSIAVILLIKVSGLIMVIALITIPVTISNLLFKKISTIVISSFIIALLVQLLGLYLSLQLNVSTGPLIIVSMVFIYTIVVLIKSIKTRLT